MQLITSTAPVSKTRLQKLCQAAGSDPTLKQPTRVVYQGYPTSRKDCPSNPHVYWNHTDKITEDGMLYKQYKLPVLEASNFVSVAHVWATIP